MNGEDLFRVEHNLIDYALLSGSRSEYTPEQLFFYIVGIHHTINRVLYEMDTPIGEDEGEAVEQEGN